VAVRWAKEIEEAATALHDGRVGIFIDCHGRLN
jgi:hypothetical protein